MSNVTHLSEVRVIAGVDTHLDVNVVFAIDTTGRRLGEFDAPTTIAGCKAIETWVKSFGTIEAFGIEGTSSYGAGLSRYLRANGHDVIEVNRPNRALRRSKGKSDTVDAESAARSVLAGTATAIPKSGDDQVENIRALKVARQGAIKARTAAANSLTSLRVTAPAQLREELRGLSTIKLVRRCSGFRTSDISDPTSASKVAMRSIAKRYEDLETEIKLLDSQLNKLVPKAAPRLVQVFGVGPGVASMLLIAAGDNPERLVSEASFASLCGASPVLASSGKTNRHRLNRGGNRQANSALYTVVKTRLAHDKATQEYMARRIAEGKSKKEVIRCLKRLVARELYYVLLADATGRVTRQLGDLAA